ncbi:amidase [Acidobacteriota bacterium]
MKRRDFLRCGLVGGAAAIAGPTLTSCQKSSQSNVVENIPKAFELEEITISELQEGMETGRLTARSIAEMYLSRIDDIDKNNQKLSSVLEVNPDLLTIADNLDAERKEGRVWGPLHGIPIIIKDNIDTADKLQTTAGSLALLGSKVPKDAFIVQQLRKAGAIILGKSNLSEWANFRSTRSSSGWSGRGGQTKNPYVLDRNPCGSSSGSGASVSANLCSVAIGTETDGSIVCPATANGIVGIKPTIGLVSRSGIIPIAHSQDTAGPMARTVRDAVILLGALTGMDSEDKATSKSNGGSFSDYTQFLDPNGLKGARIGVARKTFGFHEKVDVLMEEAIDVMKKMGAEVIDPADIETDGKFGDSEYEVLLYEFKADLNKYLARLGPEAPVKTLKDIIAFNEQNREREMPYFEQEIFIEAEKKGPLTDEVYIKALKQNHRLAGKEGIDKTIQEHKLDAIIAPTGGPPWTTDLVNGDHGAGGSSHFAAVSGYANITVPAGYIFGLPIGISFFAGAFSEPTLIKLAYSYEQATKFRQPPQLLPTLDLS